MEANKIRSWEIQDHGLQAPSLGTWAGCGMVGTSWETLGTGSGSSRLEALREALEDLAAQGWEASAADVLRMELELPDADADLVSREEETAVREELERRLPARWILSQRPSSGLEVPSQELETREDAVREALSILERAEARGMDVQEIGEDRWEILEPDSAVLVSDLAGTLELRSNEIERWEMEETIREELGSDPLRVLVCVLVSGEEVEA